MPSPITARPWKSSPTTPRPTTTSASPWPAADRSTRPSRIIRKALEIKPDYAEAHNNLGLALASRGQVDEAIAHYRKALEIKPDYAEAHNNLGNVPGRPRTGRRGHRPLPEGLGNQARLRRSPRQPWKRCWLTAGRIDEAIVHYQKALDIKPDYADAHYNLGLALARRGHVNEALDHFHKALDLASARNDRALADAIRAKLKLQQSIAPAGNVP